MKQLMIMINYSAVHLMILLENSHYGDHQHGKISQLVVIFKEENQFITANLNKLLSLELLWELVLDHKMHLEPMELGHQF